MNTQASEFPDLDAMISAAPESPTTPVFTEDPHRFPHGLPKRSTPSSELIPINRANTKPSVNARDLHAFLENGDHFSTWIKERINQFGFTEGVDFSSYSASADKPTGGRPSKEYALSLDMAKELSMVERNARGKQARQYFIECERVAKQVTVDPSALLNDPAFLRTALLTNVEKVIALETTVSKLTPKAEALERIADTEGLLNITNAAKVLQIRPKHLFSYLDRYGWTYRRAGNEERIPYQARIQQGLMVMKAHTITSATTGEVTIKERALITAKGLSRLATEFSEDLT